VASWEVKKISRSGFGFDKLNRRLPKQIFNLHQAAAQLS
jgi:hypothetical protein